MITEGGRACFEQAEGAADVVQMGAPRSEKRRFEVSHAVMVDTEPDGAYNPAGTGKSANRLVCRTTQPSWHE